MDFHLFIIALLGLAALLAAPTWTFGGWFIAAMAAVMLIRSAARKSRAGDMLINLFAYAVLLGIYWFIKR